MSTMACGACSCSGDNAVPEGLVPGPGYHAGGRLHLRSVYAEHEVAFYGHGAGFGSGDFQPLARRAQRRPPTRGISGAVNPRAQVEFEKEGGELFEYEDELPFDLNAEIIDISDIDYGIWYVDAMDHPEALRWEDDPLQGAGYEAPGNHAGVFCAGPPGHDLLRGRHHCSWASCAGARTWIS